MKYVLKEQMLNVYNKKEQKKTLLVLCLICLQPLKFRVYSNDYVHDSKRQNDFLAISLLL